MAGLDRSEVARDLARDCKDLKRKIEVLYATVTRDMADTTQLQLETLVEGVRSEFTVYLEASIKLAIIALEEGK